MLKVGIPLALALAALSFAGVIYMKKSAEIPDLIARSRAEFIRVPGASFTAGNYDIKVALMDGSIETRPVAYPSEARPPHEVTLAPYLMAQFMVRNADYALFRRKTGRARLPAQSEDLNWDDDNIVAEVPYHEALAYCEWLGTLLNMPVTLPSEDQWEFAARSGGLILPWATNDGTWQPGVNIWEKPENAGFVYDRPARDAMPPNPYGFYGMVGSLGQWILANEADETRIIKGAGRFDATIPSRGVITPVTRAPLMASFGEAFRNLAFFDSENEEVFFGGGGIMCVVNLAPGQDFGDMGKAAGPVEIDLPEVHGPYDARNRLVVK